MRGEPEAVRVLGIFDTQKQVFAGPPESLRQRRQHMGVLKGMRQPVINRILRALGRAEKLPPLIMQRALARHAAHLNQG